MSSRWPSSRSDAVEVGAVRRYFSGMSVLLVATVFLGIGCSRIDGGRGSHADLAGVSPRQLLLGRGDAHEACRSRLVAMQEKAWREWSDSGQNRYWSLACPRFEQMRKDERNAWMLSLWDMVVPQRIDYVQFISVSASGEMGAVDCQMVGYRGMRASVVRDVAVAAILDQDVRLALTGLSALSGRSLPVGNEGRALLHSLDRLRACAEQAVAFRKIAREPGKEWLKWNVVLEQLILASVVERITGKSLAVRWDQCLEPGFGQDFLMRLRESLSGIDQPTFDALAQRAVRDLGLLFLDDGRAAESEGMITIEERRAIVAHMEYNSLASNVLKRPVYFAK